MVFLVPILELPGCTPILRSLLINLAVLAVTGLLSWQFSQPLLVVVGLMLMQHEMARFAEKSNRDDDDDDEDAQPMGFLADVDAR